MTKLSSYVGLIALCAVTSAPAALAQSSVQGVPNAVQGFSTNRDQPIQIEATALEVRDKESIAIFSGNVHVIQGDTHMRSKTLVVYYDQSSGKTDGKPSRDGKGRPAKAATPGPSGEQQIKKLEAQGGVVVTQKDQTASGDSGVYDTQSNAITLLGNVIIAQGGNVLKGERLLVDMTTGVSRMESGSGRVTGVFQPGSQGAAQGGAPIGLPSPTQMLAPQPQREAPRSAPLQTRPN